MSLFEGDFQAKVVMAEVGSDKNGRPKVRIEFEVVGGERSGFRASYDGKLAPENIKYTKQHMKACGWNGESIRTFVDDVQKAALVVPIRCEIATYEPPDGGKIRQWTAVRSVGVSAPPLGKLSDGSMKQLDAWFGEDEKTKPGGMHSDDDLPF